jgi:hypothetical protein
VAVRRGSAALWTAAFALTLVSAVWQRVSGPTYPARGDVVLGRETISLELARSHGGPGDQPVVVPVADPEVSGEVAWRRFPSHEEWRRESMRREGDALVTALPHQPPAGKLEYQVRLRRGDQEAVFPPRPAVTRFKGEVHPVVLIPHILAMFTGMLLANRAGLEALRRRGRPSAYAAWALALILLGGFVLGPAVQKQAFGAWWTGVPFGWDLTDNKTLVAGVAWAWAVLRSRGGRQARGAVVVAALVTLVVFAIPHSAAGSELDWSRMGGP